MICASLNLSARVAKSFIYYCDYYSSFFSTDYEHMTVKRRFSEFVMLHKRLRKFHGNLGGLQLPQRKSMNALNNEFISYRQKELCIYLQVQTFLFICLSVCLSLSVSLFVHLFFSLLTG